MKPLVSHADITPALLQMLHKHYAVKLPEQVSWLGNQLTGNRVFDVEKNNKLIKVSLE